MKLLKLVYRQIGINGIFIVMKIVITENKFKEGILKYINSMFDINNIGWTYGIDDWGNEVDYAITFYQGDYDEDEGLFKWYGEGYFTSEESEGWGEEYRIEMNDKTPILAFDDVREYDNLEGLFGNRWQPIFAEWFEENFKVPVKTIIR
jgi:hypothetical protein